MTAASASVKLRSEMSLSEIRSFSQRRRMGISESSMQEKSKSSQMSNEQAISFIRENFTYRECMRYVGDESAAAETNDEFCCCGQRRSHHYPTVNGDEESKDGWTEDDIMTYGDGTNAFGSIIFRDEHSGARKPSKFIRVGCNLQMPGSVINIQKDGKIEDAIDAESLQTIDSVLQFFKDNWQLFNPLPNLAVAVIGGAKNFKLDAKRVDVFTRGLVKVANSTNALIFTGGCNFGVMKIVGDAVREGQTMGSDDDAATLSSDADCRTRCIGICQWGYVKDRDNLIIRSRGSNRRPQTSYGHHRTSSGVSVSAGPPQLPDESIPYPNLFKAYNEQVRMYTSSKSGKSEAYLNPDHTHFIFVDNGYRNHQCIHNNLFMMGLLQRLNSGEVFVDKVLPPGMKIDDYSVPSVVVVVEGGLAVVDTIYFCVQIKIPVVICTHTGRAADIFATAVEIMLDIKGALTNPDDVPVVPQPGDTRFDIIQTKVAKAFFKGATSEAIKQEIERVTSRIFETSANTQLITLFDLTAREDFDSAILSALLKVDSPDKNDGVLEQMDLALTWDRSDIAEEKIFPFYPEDKPKGKEKLKQVMKTALLKTKLGFVSLLIGRGFSIKEFLTVDVLASLYEQVDKDKYLKQLFYDFRRAHMAKVYKIRKKHHNKSMADMLIYWRFLTDLLPFYEHPTVDDQNRLPNPYRELFLWSVLLNRVEMATFFWQKIEHPIMAALLASLLLKSCAERATTQDSEVGDGYMSAKKEFERLATELINKCALSDRHMSVIALERKHPEWGRVTCLQIAAFADCKKFVGSAVCQDVLNQRWQRKIVSSWPFICLGIVFAPFVPFIIQFDFGDSTNVAVSRKLSRLFDLYRFSSQVDDISVAAQKHAQKKVANTPAITCQDLLHRYHRFFRAPVTKFCFSTLTSFLFLALYTYVLLFAYHDQSNGYQRSFEYLLHAWVFTLVCEAIYEIFRFPVFSFRRKAAFWWKTVWNKAETIAITLYLIAFVMRLIADPSDQTLNFVAKNFFAFALFVFCVKLLRVLNASTSLGPQLVMIGNMLLELVPFLILICLCLVAFGVAHAAFYYEEAIALNFENIRFIVAYSFWPLVSGPSLDEVMKAEAQEGSDYSTAMTCHADNATQCGNGSTNSSLFFNSTSNFNLSLTSLEPNIVTTTLASITTTVISNISNNSSDLSAANASALTQTGMVPVSFEDGELKVWAPPWFLSAFLAFWVLISVLLVNLLIAIFSNVYNEVNENANEIWKYYQLEMISEYENKQALPPPLSILGLIWRAVKRFYRFIKSYHHARRTKLATIGLPSSGPADDQTSFTSETGLIDVDKKEFKRRKSLLLANQENDHDPALQFEHETRAAMTRDKKREEKHGGVVNQLSDIHKQLATIRDQVSRLGRLETIAEAAVVEIDKADNESNREEMLAPKKERILSASKARARGSTAFNGSGSGQSGSNEILTALESRLDNLSSRADKVQELAVQVIAALKARQAAQLQAQSQQQQQQQQIYQQPQAGQTDVVEHHVNINSMSAAATTTTTPSLETAAVVSIPPLALQSQLPSTPTPGPFYHHPYPPPQPMNQFQLMAQQAHSPLAYMSADISNQLVLPVAGVGLASVPRPVMHSSYPITPRTWSMGHASRSQMARGGSPSENSQVILDWPSYNSSRSQSSPRFETREENNDGNNN